MFNENKSSIFRNEDEIGIQPFRDDASYIFRQNAIIVNLIRKNRNSEDIYSQGELGGIDIQVFNNNIEEIEINIASEKSKAAKLDKEGYTAKGEVEYNAFCKYNTDIQNEDIIQFKQNYINGITKGDKFRVVFKDFGEYQGQFAFKNFGLIRI
ncbi:MAG: hypothetical protein PHT02_11650 [Tissierellia bacterium]|jgi:hypothetical protein|nr:hypothetical protein [Tissierellia bacterium]